MVFQETPVGQHPGWMKPIRDLGVQIAGTPLEAALEQFQQELKEAGIIRIKPTFYLSDEWGVPFDTTAIAIPFYLARNDLIGLHKAQVGFIEGATRADLLRYLRHEMGHVINYGYKLYDREDWTAHFGSIENEYVEEYHPVPFHRDYVQHLPGWYAQKHPDEDWAETFAVWLTPGLDWKKEYASRPRALAKIQFCDQLMEKIKTCDPTITSAETDESVEEMTNTLKDFYGNQTLTEAAFPFGLDASLHIAFEDTAGTPRNPESTSQPASAFIRSLELELMADIYRWTGHFPERTRSLLRHLENRADELKLCCPPNREMTATVAVTALVTALAMNHVHHGSYSP